MLWTALLLCLLSSGTQSLVDFLGEIGILHRARERRHGSRRRELNQQHHAQADPHHGSQQQPAKLLAADPQLVPHDRPADERDEQTRGHSPGQPGQADIFEEAALPRLGARLCY